MGIKVRQPKDKLARGETEWWVFVNHQGKRFSMKVGEKAMAEEVAREFKRALLVLRAQEKGEQMLEQMITKMGGDPMVFK